jgi:hypothetical protein
MALAALSSAVTIGAGLFTIFKLTTKNDIEQQIINNANTTSAYSDPADTKNNPYTISFDTSTLPVVNIDTGVWGLPRVHYGDPSGTNATILTYGFTSHNNLTKS